MNRHRWTDRSDLLEEIVERFEAAHGRGEQPVIGDYLELSESTAERRQWLTELVHADLECRLMTGERVRVEDYITVYPELAEDRDVAFGLIFSEFNLRSQTDATVSWDEMLVRFPEFRARILESSTLAHFRLLARLGNGNFGTVWKAEDQRLERLVAIKIPHPGRMASRKDVERFVREGRSLARLQHPGIITVHEVGTHKGVPFIVSEFVVGQSLASESFSLHDSVQLVIQIAEALEYVHSHGVIHRDIKPSNVVLCKPTSTAPGSTARWQAKLVDFGLSRRLDADATLTQVGEMLGTPAYMSPEQVGDPHLSIDARSDVYSLGVLLFELLGGRVPFRGAAATVVHQILHCEPPSPRELNKAVPRDLEAVCLKCLQKSPAERYAGVADLAADLHRWLRGEPTIARPLGATRRGMKWLQRHPTLAALWFVSIVAVMAVTSVNLWRQQQLAVALIHSQASQSETEDARQKAQQADAFSQQVLYAAHMREAQQAWRDGNYGRIREILDRYADGHPAAELRHFEWYHLNYLCQVPHLDLRGHSDEVYAAAYSPDDRLLLSGGKDGTLRIWDATTGAPLAVLKEHTSCVNSIDFSPDGDTFVTASCDQTIRLWSLKQRSVIRTLQEPWAVTVAAFIDDGRRIISLSVGLPASQPPLPRYAHVWNVAEGTWREDWPPAGESFQWVTWDRSAQKIVTSSQGIAKVWNRCGETWAASHEFNFGETTGSAWLTPDGEELLVPGWPSRVRSFRLRDGAFTRELIGDGWQIGNVSFSPSGKRYATCSRSLRVFDYPANMVCGSFPAPAGIWYAAWSKSENSIASVSANGLVQLWDLRFGQPYVDLRTTGMTGPLEGYGYLHDGQWINVAYPCGNATWNTETGSIIPREQLTGDPIDASQLADTPANERLTAQYEWLPQWNHHAYVLKSWFAADEHDLPGARIFKLRADHPGIVEYGTDWQRSWDQDPVRPRRKSQYGNKRGLTSLLDVSPDGQRLCYRLADGSIEVTTAFDEQPVRLDVPPATSVAVFSPSGNHVLLGDSGSFRECDANTGQQRRFWQADFVWTATYSADGRRIALATAHDSIRIYDSATGELMIRLDGATNDGQLLFAPDGTSLVAPCGQDGTLRLWPGVRSVEKQE